MKRLITLVIIFIILLLLFLRYGGVLLVKDDNVKGMSNAAIVLLMGSVADRSLGAAELYNAGDGNNILMVESDIKGREVLEEKGITIVGSADNSKSVLTQLGVNPDAITIIPGDAQSTKDEALIIAAYLEEVQEIDTIVLVTSEYHSFRSKLIFSKALKKLDVTIYAAPTTYDSFEAKGWYKSREDAKYVATEYMKLAHYLLLDQFRMK